jgi:hypothetical protein
MPPKRSSAAAMNRAAPSTPRRTLKRKEREIIDLTSPSPKASRAPKRQKANASIVSPEIRQRRYRDHAPQDVLVKMERVMTQRMFLLERSGRKNGALKEDFTILGSTGNVYTVSVTKVPTYIYFQWN